jgi:hypothetical protein
VLWSLRTTPNHSIGFTLFFLVYGAEAMLPTNIDLLEEAREQALARLVLYQQQLR